MATLIRSVRNETSSPITIRVPGINPSGPVVLQPNVIVDMLTLVSEDELEALQPVLASLVAGGDATTQATIEDTVLHNAEGELAADVTTLQGDVATAQSDISTLQSEISTVQSDVSTNENDISTNQSDISTNQSNIAVNTSRLDSLAGYNGVAVAVSPGSPFTGPLSGVFGVPALPGDTILELVPSGPHTLEIIATPDTKPTPTIATGSILMLLRTSTPI